MAAAANDVQLVSLPQSEEHLTSSPPIHDSEDERSAGNGRRRVSWSGPGDAENPMNWSAWLKVTNIVLVSFLTFVTALASSMVAPGVPQAMQDFNSNSDIIADFIISVYVLGFAVGPMFLAPLSELYGRLPIYHISNIGFIVFTALCAISSSVGMLIACRFFQGVFGAAPVTNGGGTIADVVPQEKRGGALAIYSVAPLLGPVIGPVAGGFLVAAKGWRWVFWVLAMVGGAMTLLCLALLRETFAVVILERRAARLRKQTGDGTIRSQLTQDLSARQLFARAIVRPSKILILSPIVSALSLYMGVVYGYRMPLPIYFGTW